MGANAHAVPKLPLAAGTPIEINWFASRANVLVLNAASQLATALGASSIVSVSVRRGLSRLFLGGLFVHKSSFVQAAR